MKLNKLVLVTLMALGAVACDKNDGGDELTVGKKNVTLKLGDLGSRSVGTPAEAKASKLGNVAIFFSDGTNILETRKFDTNSDEWTDLTGGNGYTFHRLDAKIKKVHIIGNAKNLTGQYMSVTDLKSVVVNATDEQDMDDVTMFAEETLVAANDPGTDTEDGLKLYTATVNLKPLVARIEIGNIQCTDLGSRFSKLELEAIGLMNFYEATTIGGTVADANFLNMDNVLEPGTLDPDNTKYVFGSLGNEWGWNGITGTLDDANDVHNPQISGETPESGKYVYNFIPTEKENEALRVKLYMSATNKETNAEALNNTLSALFASTTFEAGKIYTLNLKFTEDDLGTWDPDDQICVQVTVTVEPWSIVPLTPTYE